MFNEIELTDEQLAEVSGGAHWGGHWGFGHFGFGGLGLGFGAPVVLGSEPQVLEVAPPQPQVVYVGETAQSQGSVYELVPVG